MHVATGLAALFHELMHERQDRIADDVSLVAQEVEIQGRHIALRRNFLGRLSRDDTVRRLRARQRDLHLDVARDEGVVGKDLAHAWGAEGVTEQDGVENSRGGRDNRLRHLFLH